MSDIDLVTEQLSKAIINDDNDELYAEMDIAGAPKYAKPISFIFDTETTGLAADARIIELAFIVVDANGREIMRYSSLVNHPGLVIKNAFIHHISTRMCQASGISIRKMLMRVRDGLRMSDVIVAHNIVFDIARLRYEAGNVCPDIIDMIDNKRHICTMKYAKSSLVGAGGAINAKLVTLYSRYVGDTAMVIAHRAMADTEMCLGLYMYILNNNNKI